MTLLGDSRKTALQRVLVATGVLLVLALSGLLVSMAFAVRNVGHRLDLHPGHSSNVESVAWSPDGKQLASASGDQTVKVWEVATGQLRRTLTGHSASVKSVAWSPDGQQLASASEDNTVKVWEPATGQLRRTLTGHSSRVLSVAWSPDGQQLASASQDNTVKVWEAATGQLRRTFAGHSDNVFSVAWSPDGQQLASASADHTVKVWEAGTGQLWRTLAGHSAQVFSVVWSPDGRQLASGSQDNTVKVWEAGTGQLRRTLKGHSELVWAVAWSPDGQLLAGGSGDNAVTVWEAATGQLRRTLTGHLARVLSVAWSPDGKLLASGSLDGTVKVWESATGQLLRSLTGPWVRVRSVAWSPDGRQLASGGSNMVRVWDAAAGRLRHTLTGHSGSVSSVAWSPDGQRLATGSDDHTVKVWEAATGQLLQTLTGSSTTVFSVGWSPDGELLAGAGVFGVKVWHVTTGQILQSLAHSPTVFSVAWSPDGKLLASASFVGVVKVWESATGQLRRTLTLGFLGYLPSSIAWSPNGQELASPAENASVKVWEVATGQLRRILPTRVSKSVAWSPNGKFLASGNLDGSMQLWEVATGRLLGTLIAHSSDVSSVAWSPDGRQLASGSSDGTLGLWWVDQPGKVLLIGNLIDSTKRFLTNPLNLRYECSAQEDADIEIHFGDDWESRYRLADYRNQLRVQDVRELFGEEPILLHPGILIESAAFVRRHLNIIGIVTLVYLAGAGGLLIGTRSLSASQLARRFFPEAGLLIEKELNPKLFSLSGNELEFVAVWPQPEDKLIESIARHRKGATGRFRMYLIYRESDPDTTMRIGQKLNCLAIPLAATGLERALADGKAKETLREMEEPFVTRTDPYDEQKAITDATWFFGRAALLDELPAVLRQGQHAGLFGLRKVGKTSLLSQLRLTMIDVPVVLLDCQAYAAARWPPNCFARSWPGCAARRRGCRELACLRRRQPRIP